MITDRELHRLRNELYRVKRREGRALEKLVQALPDVPHNRNSIAKGIHRLGWELSRAREEIARLRVYVAGDDRAPDCDGQRRG